MIDMRVTEQFGVDKKSRSLMQSLRVTQEFKEKNVDFSGEGFTSTESHEVCSTRTLHGIIILLSLRIIIIINTKDWTL